MGTLEKFTNEIRNAILGLVLVFFIVCLSLHLAGVSLYVMKAAASEKVTVQQVLTKNILLSSKPAKKVVSFYRKWLFKGRQYDTTLKAVVIGSTGLPLFIMLFFLWRNRKTIYAWRPFRKGEALHGDARWATEEDITKANLRVKRGMLVGEDKKGFLVAEGYQHSLLFAPTGSGKGVGFVIPNLLYWEDSIFVHDIKLENYELTSGWRSQMGQQVYLWNPASPDGMTHCYNPMDWISKKPGQMVDDVQKIGSLILPKQEFWENEARALFVGVVLYLLGDPTKKASFGEVVRTMRSDDVAHNLAVALDTLGDMIHPVGYMNLAAFLQKADKERSAVVSTLNSKLDLWANPLIDTATATSDFDIQTFKRTPTTVYVGLTPDNIQRLQPLMQVFYQQASEFLSRSMPTADDKYGVMFLMDEFPTLGKMEQFMNGIAYFRGYKVRLFLIIQDTQQLKGIYKDAGMNSFLSNSTYRITFAANNTETATLISQLCGNKTVETVSQSRPKFFDLNPASKTQSISKAQRALLLPQEVITLDRDHQIILIESSPPIKCKKIKYFQHPFFLKRLLPKIDIPIQEPYDASKHKQKEELEDADYDESEEGYEDGEELVDDEEEFEELSDDGDEEEEEVEVDDYDGDDEGEEEAENVEGEVPEDVADIVRSTKEGGSDTEEDHDDDLLELQDLDYGDEDKK